MDHRAVLSVVGLCAGLAASPAFGQYALGNGLALNRGQTAGNYGRAYNAATSFYNELAFRNSIITGNAPNGLSFRGNVGYVAPGEFLGRLPSNDIFAFRRDSLYSGLAGMGIRGTEALQYQFALTTGAMAPPSLTGNLSVNRWGGSSPVPVYGGTDTSSYSRVPTIDGSAPLARPDPASASADPRGTGLWSMRSTSAFNSARSIQPSLLQIKNDQNGVPVGVVASTLRGVALDVLDPMSSTAAFVTQPGEDEKPQPGFIDRAAPSTSLLRGPDKLTTEPIRDPLNVPKPEDTGKPGVADPFKPTVEDPFKPAADPFKTPDPFAKPADGDLLKPSTLPDGTPGGTKAPTDPLGRPTTDPTRGGTPGPGPAGQARPAAAPVVRTAYDDLIQRLQQYDKSLPPLTTNQLPDTTSPPGAAKAGDAGAAVGQKPGETGTPAADDPIAKLFETPAITRPRTTPDQAPGGAPGSSPAGERKNDVEAKSVASSEQLLSESWKRRLIDIRIKLQPQPMTLGGSPLAPLPGQEPVKAPGGEGGYTGVYTADSMKLLRMAAGGPSVKEFAMGGFDAYSHHIRVATEFMAAGRYFDAEERFTTALSARRGDPMARTGRIHAQIGGGLLSSALVNLRQLVIDAPEVAGLRYESNLLPASGRMDGAVERTRRLINDPKSPNTEMGLLMAYIGWQQNNQALIVEGLAAFDSTPAGEKPGDPDAVQRHNVAELLREVWTKPAESAPAPSPAAPAEPKPEAPAAAPEK